MISAHHAIAVTESSQPASARASARELADNAGFGPVDAHRVGLVATEMATNLVKHARGGEMLLRTVSREGPAEIELLAIDRGPGMPDIARSLADGHSTSGSPGTGLGAIRRLSDEFDIYSDVKRGSAILARLRMNRAPCAAANGFEIDAVSVPKPGEEVCGDGWSARLRQDEAGMILADGLGHGLGAADAAIAAIATFTSHAWDQASAALEAVHEGIRHTRGAAAAVAFIERRPRVVRFAGVGNIAGSILTSNGDVRHVVSHNGTLGHEARHFREYTYPWEPGALLVMHSDGLTSHWSLANYPGLRARHPALIAAILYRDFSRQRDDVTVLVAREPV